MKPPNFHSIKPILAAAALACAVACAGSVGYTQTGAIMIAIDKMTPGASPADFEFARTGQGGPGQWAVVADTSAAAGLAIEQTSTDRTDYRFPLAIYQPVSASDVDVTVRFKAVDGKVDQAGGVAVRLSDADNYYVVRANALEDNVRFYRVVEGRREQLGGVNTRVTANEWHQLGLRAEGQRVHDHLRWQATVHRERPVHRGRGQGRALDQGRQRNALRSHRNPGIAMTIRCLA